SGRKWVAIASALAGEPAVVVLDEPTLGQDYPSRERLRSLVRELDDRGRSVLVVTHDMDFVGEACPTAVVLSHGRVRYSGPTSKPFADHPLIRRPGLGPPHVDHLAAMLGPPGRGADAGFLAAGRHGLRLVGAGRS